MLVVLTFHSAYFGYKKRSLNFQPTHFHGPNLDVLIEFLKHTTNALDYR